MVRPNFDTLYSSAWIDLTGGPVQVHVPDSDERYYMLPMLDMWTDVFANPGKRTTGTGAREIVLTPPGYSGDVPRGTLAIEAPTPYVWIIGRTQTNGPSDYPAVRAFQDGLAITEIGSREAAVPEPVDVDTEPLRIVNGMSGVEFLDYATRAFRVSPIHPTDHSQVARLALLGVVPGEPFDASKFTGAERAEIQAGAEEALATLVAAPNRLGVPVNGWVSYTTGMGVYGNDYLKRAMISLAGLGANPPEDAIYPPLITDADAEPVTGDTNYVIHFDAEQLPPVAAFWSITMYDAEGFQAANELDRFAIGDRGDLTYNADGSLDIYIQHDSPGPQRMSNWLPAPKGPLGITMRLYAPSPAALDGTWNPPPVRKYVRNQPDSTTSQPLTPGGAGVRRASVSRRGGARHRRSRSRRAAAAFRPARSAPRSRNQESRTTDVHSYPTDTSVHSAEHEGSERDPEDPETKASIVTDAATVSSANA